MWGVCSAAKQRRVDWRWRMGLVLVVVVLGVLWLASSAAADSQCPAANPSDFGPCGPTFTLPEWGDAGGWKGTDQYSTIQFGRVLGNGRDQLIGRSADGIEIWNFDTTLGQWRPAVDSHNKPMILTGFADPPQLTQANPTFTGTDWTGSGHFGTIQVADVLGTGRDQIIARANSGITVWSYTPGAGGVVGEWSQVYSGEPFSDADGFIGLDGAVASQTIQTADLTGGSKADLFGVTPSGAVQAYEWNGSGFTQLPAIPDSIPPFTEPAQSQTLQASPPIGGRQELWWADTFGMIGLRLNGAGNGWTRVKTPGLPSIGPCAGLETIPTPWDSSPAYYSTCRMVNVTANPSAVQVVGRGVDGLDLWKLTAQGTWQQLATLTAFSDANGWSQSKYYRSIQYADINGAPSGQQEVIARGPNGVVAYTYNAATNQWDQLPSANMISLTDDPWGGDPSYYSTLRLGDASGDGRQDTLIARGPYGIRTWFYGRFGHPGWNAYASAGYPAFTGTEAAAYTALNALPKIQGYLTGASVGTIRDYLAQETAPTAGNLGSLLSDIALAAVCSGEQSSLPYPHYATCTPPAGSDITAAVWTPVVNEVLHETWEAQQVVAFYAELDKNSQQLFIAQGAELPAIAGTLNLSQATGTPTTWNGAAITSGALGIAASVTFEFPPVSAALWVAAELVSMLPSASPALTNDFNGTYNQLQNVFASGVTQTAKAAVAQSQQVRSDLNLLTLVAQLREQGTWAMDDTGIQSASNQAFALSVYRTLMPTMYTRYSVTNCDPNGNGESDDPHCSGPSGVGVVGNTTNFTEIGVPPTLENGAYSTPCTTDDPDSKCFYQDQLVNSSIANAIWGPVPANCDYQPGNANTVWTFGCPLGVNPATSVSPSLLATGSSNEVWDFPTYVGTPYIDGETPVSGTAATAKTGVGSSLGRAATVNLRGAFRLVRAVDVSRATVVLDRVLFDSNGVGELVRPVAARAVARGAAASSRKPSSLAPMPLRHTGPGTFSSPLAAAPGQRPPRVSLKLTPRRGRSLAFGLKVSNVAVPIPPAACVLGTVGVTSRTVPFPLTLKLTLREPKRKPQTISVSALFTCRRDASGAIRALTVVQPKRPKLGPGLSVRIRRPRHLTIGETRTLTVTVHNRGPRLAYDVFIRASLPAGLRVVSHSARATVRRGLILWRVTKLRSRKSRIIHLRVVPTRAVRRCTTVTANAVLRKQSTRRACIRVISARTPASGLG